MPLRGNSTSYVLPFVALTPLVFNACSVPGPPAEGTGGATSAGGAGVGATTSSGGSAADTGGRMNSGGSTSGPGGTDAGGSTSGPGGNDAGGSGPGGTNSGGSASGGGGGTSGSGGTDTGGSSSSGGSTPSGLWGEEENPSADCEVGPMPDVDSLSANPNLPDPFTKMDGTRITDKSEWLCRREEILQQSYEFIYGDKPIPEESSVSGSVTNSSISVQVSDGGGSTSFNASVSMNGATAPAPAIIVYGGFGGPPVPSGVATITFDAIEQEGGTGPKSGPFYDVYGSDHPAGYLTAQAWQVSRILDVLQQDPSVIDPFRVGVTGCSRLGKGAFVAGALDNRIALTIPIESGLGGTVGLRLVEVFGTGGEWPYHGISYVRWMSEVALGQFTSGNNASADNTDRLPIDMHSVMGLIAPRGLYIVDNPGISNLDPHSAWTTANVGQMIYDALGVADHMSYEGASGNHCSWRSAYTPKLEAMVDKFLKGNDSAATGGFNTDLGNPPNPEDHIDWEVPTLSGEL